MPVNEKTINEQIKTGTLAPLYFIYGPEQYLKRYYADKIIVSAVDPAFESFNLIKLDGAKCTVNEINENVEALPLMANKKCVVVTDFKLDALPKQEQEKLQEMLADLPDSAVLIFYMNQVEVAPKGAKWKGIITQMDKVGAVLECTEKTTAELTRYITAKAAKQGSEIHTDTAQYLISYVGNALSVINNELDKLTAYRTQGSITKDDIRLLCTKSLDASVYDLSKAIVSGKYDRAYTILGDLFSQRVEPVIILSAISSAFVDLYRAKVAAVSGMTTDALARQLDYRGKEWRLKNAARDSRGMHITQLRKALNILMEADQRLKSTRVPDRAALEVMMAKLMVVFQ